jgi:hypothetical protein
MTSVFTRHTTDDISKTRAGIDLFDDERSGQTTIYILFTDGTRAGMRDVDMSDENAHDCVEAWCKNQIVRDYRTFPAALAAVDMVASVAGL